MGHSDDHLPYDPGHCGGCAIFGDPAKRFGLTEAELSSIHACSSVADWNRTIDAILESHAQPYVTKSGVNKLRPCFPVDFYEKAHASGISARIFRKT